MSPAEEVVLTDELGRRTGTAPKAEVHHAATPLHLAFSAYVFDAHGALLVTRRAAGKRTFPGVWTNTVCGHPGPGERLSVAVARRAADELGLPVDGLRLVLPQFRYRAQMGGVVENELCPVFVGRAGGTGHRDDPGARPDAGGDIRLAVDPSEVGGAEWVPWADFAGDVIHGRRAVSPWCALQVAQLVTLGPDPAQWPAADPALLPPACPPEPGWPLH